MMKGFSQTFPGYFAVNSSTDPERSGLYLANALAAQRISIRGARTHNLKNIDLDIPRNQLVEIGRAHV